MSRQFVDDSFDGVPRLWSQPLPKSAPKERLHLGEEARAELIRGFNLVARALRATYGPLGQPVVVSSERLDGAPEYIRDAATLARRILELRDRFETMGAMLARHLAWRMHTEVGDGAALVVILAEAMLRGAQRYLAAGIAPTVLREALNGACAIALHHLETLVRPLRDRRQARELAIAHAGDAEVGRIVSEVVDVVGPDAEILVREHTARELDRQYIEGAQWEGGLLSMYLVSDETRRVAEIRDPAVAVTDLDIEDAREVAALLDVAARSGAPGLVLVAASIKGQALTTLIRNHQKGFPCFAVKAPGTRDDRVHLLDDMALLTGGRYLGAARGDLLSSMKPEDLGRVRIASADATAFRILGPGGNPRAIRERARQLRSRLRSIKAGDPESELLRARLARLVGGTGIILVGGTTETLRGERKQQVESTLSALRSMYLHGIVPGAGAALLSCARKLADAERDLPSWPGMDILSKALAAPARALAFSAGRDPSAVAARAARVAPDRGFDVRRGVWVNLAEAGIMDSYEVVRKAILLATSMVGTTLMTEALVLTRDAEVLEKANVDP